MTKLILEIIDKNIDTKIFQRNIIILAKTTYHLGFPDCHFCIADFKVKCWSSRLLVLKRLIMSHCIPLSSFFHCKVLFFYVWKLSYVSFLFTAESLGLNKLSLVRHSEQFVLLTRDILALIIDISFHSQGILANQTPWLPRHWWITIQRPTLVPSLFATSHGR